MSRKLSRRQFLAQAGGVVTGGVLAACVGLPTPEVAEKAVKETAPSEIQGELTIDMQYVPGKVTADTPKPLFEILRIAEEYESMHPGVKIKFVEPFKPTEAMNQPTYFKAGAAAGTLPDISFTYGLSFIYDKDVWVPTTEFLQEPNPYIPASKPGHDRWIDQWFEDVQPQPMADGNTYDIPVGWGGPGLIIGYNKEMFDKAGITATPKTYYDYYLISERLLETGVIPCESMLLSWEWDRMVEYLIRAMGIFELIDIDGDGFCTDLEETRGALAGLVRLDAPYWVEPTRIWKAATRYYQPGYLQLAQTTAAIGIGEIFMTEQSAMLWNAGQIWARLMSMGGSAKWGVFNLPRLTDRLTPWGEKDPTWLIARTTGSKTITKTAQDRGHVAMAVDFMKFMTTPTNSARLIEERLGTELVLPTIKELEDLAVDEDVKELVKDYEAPHAPPGFSSDRIGDWHFWYEWFSAIQAYFVGDMTLEEMIKMQEDTLPQYIEKIIEDKGWEDGAKDWKKLKEKYTPPPWGEYKVPTEPFVMPFST